MNPAVLIFGANAIGMKRVVAVVLAALVIVVSLPFTAVMSMGPDVLSFLSSSPDAKSAEMRGFYNGGPVEGNTYAWGNCTYWSYAMRLWAEDPIPNTWGNANTWDDRAAADGYVVNRVPAVNAIFQTDAGPYGHAAYVTYVDSTTGDWTISEMNWPTLNVVTHRTFPAEASQHYNFIHGKIGEPAWKSSNDTSTSSPATGN